MKLDGIIVPLITPLKQDESLDEESLGGLIEHVIAGGVSGIFVLGSCGEGPALSEAIRERVVFVARERCKGRVPVFVGAASMGTRQTIELAKKLTASGGEVIVVTAPFYFAQTQDEIVTHVSQIARGVNVPIVVYNIPQMVKTIIEPETMERIAQVAEVIAIKDSLGDMTRFQRILAIKHRRPEFGVFQGAEGVAAMSIASGADGAVLGLANVAPKLCLELFTAAKRGDLPRAWALQERLMLLWRLHSHGQWLPCLKAAVSQLGLCGTTTSAPFAALGEDSLAAIRGDMQAAGVLSR